MKAQLEQLITMSKRPNITLQVLPFTAGGHVAMDGGFVVLGFESPDPDVIYLENQVGSLYLEEQSHVDRHNVVFNHLRAAALDPVQSRRLLSAEARDLR
ncbi:hypothetical protein Misp01_47950 [Microtetraspora sp. NBRC 13810]|nr:hypothetical protein Misp01_47950 [Microtetraspora sp. NBRC 13810]